MRLALPLSGPAVLTDAEISIRRMGAASPAGPRFSSWASVPPDVGVSRRCFFERLIDRAQRPTGQPASSTGQAGGWVTRFPVGVGDNCQLKDVGFVDMSQRETRLGELTISVAAETSLCARCAAAVPEAAPFPSNCSKDGFESVWLP